MKLSIIGTVGVPACYGGFETLFENLLDEKEHDKDITAGKDHEQALFYAV